MYLTPVPPQPLAWEPLPPSLRVAALGPSLYANAKPQLTPSFLSSLIDCVPSLLGLREPWDGIQEGSPPTAGPSNPGSRRF